MAKILDQTFHDILLLSLYVFSIKFTKKKISFTVFFKHCPPNSKKGIKSASKFVNLLIKIWSSTVLNVYFFNMLFSILDDL